MKDEFDIINLDLTDAMPKIDDDAVAGNDEFAQEYEENEFESEYDEESVEEYGEDEFGDIEYADGDGYMEEPESAEEFGEEFDGEFEDYESQDYADNYENADDEEYEPQYEEPERNEENAGDEVFQGEITVDTMIMADMVEKIQQEQELNSRGYDEDLEFTGTINYNEGDYEDDAACDEEYDEYDEEDDEDYDEEEQGGRKPALFVYIADKIKHFKLEDWLAVGGAVLVVAAGIIVSCVVINKRTVGAADDIMYEAGRELAGIGDWGDNGLIAMNDAGGAVIEVIEPEEIVMPETDEIQVTFTSVEQDLKIKFINTGSQKLVNDIEFEVTLTDKKDKEIVLKDEDKDGIIYKTPLDPGDYKVSIAPVDGYSFVDVEKTVNVKEKIAYEKIDVSQEIKSESEINVAAEDTAVNNAAAEEVAPTVTDTVEWVESTRVSLDGTDGYKKIEKSSIVEPEYSMGHIFEFDNEEYAYGNPYSFSNQVLHIVRTEENTGVENNEEGGESGSGESGSGESGSGELGSGESGSGESGSGESGGGESGSGESGSGESGNTEKKEEKRSADIKISGSSEIKAGETTSLTMQAEYKGKKLSGGSSSWSSDNTKVATVDSSGKVTAVAEGTAKISVSYTYDVTEDNTTYHYSGNGTYSISVKAGTLTVKEVTLDNTAVSLSVGKTVTIEPKAKMSDDSVVKTGFSFKSDNEKIAKVDSAGKITAVAAGTAKITATYKDAANNTKSIVCTVTVTTLTIKSAAFSKSSIELADGDSVTLEITATMSDDSKSKDLAYYTFSSDSTKVAKVDSKGKVTGESKGKATITATYKDASGNNKSITCTVNVSDNPKNDTTTKLKDKDGNQVYIKDSKGEYKEATYADYYDADEFFIKYNTQYKYTGWQTIDGNVYFYDKNNNKVTGQQIIQGVTYQFSPEGILAMDRNGIIGIDVSKWNGSIDWNAVKNSGVSFVIIRCGYRGSSTGVLVEDPKFKANIQGAKNAGLKVGVYFFTQAVNEVEAVEEASMVIGLVNGYGLSYPVFIDTEGSGGRADGLDKTTRTAVIRAFCETIKNAGLTPGVYASKSWYNDKLSYSTLSGYRIWLAQYASAPTFANRYDIWQHSEKGSVNGISGKVDMNISYLGY